MVYICIRFEKQGKKVERKGIETRKKVLKKDEKSFADRHWVFTFAAPQITWIRGLLRREKGWNQRVLTKKVANSTELKIRLRDA
jgi:hypothetical protein